MFQVFKLKGCQMHVFEDVKNLFIYNNFQTLQSLNVNKTKCNNGIDNMNEKYITDTIFKVIKLHISPIINK